MAGYLEGEGSFVAPPFQVISMRADEAGLVPTKDDETCRDNACVVRL
jgi:hypothetical protein